MKRIAIILAALLVLCCTAALAENQYYYVETPVEITDNGVYTAVIQAGTDGWEWSISENKDITSWLVTEDNTPAFADESGIAHAHLVYGPLEGAEGDVALTLEMTIDMSKVTGFAENGAYDLYFRPQGKDAIWAAGNNHGQYVDCSEKLGTVNIPAVTVDGKITGTGGKTVELDNNTAVITLAMDGLDVSLILFKFIPMLGCVIAFEDYQVYTGIFGSAWVGLKNFQTMFSYSDFSRILTNTLIMGGLRIVFCFPVPVILALMMNELQSPKLIMVLITMIFKAPTVPYFLTLRSYGLYNSVWAMILPHILTAYNMIVMRTFFQGFPKEVEESATIDGCGPFRTLAQIVLPSSKAVIAVIGLFYAVTIWNQYQHPLYFIQDMNLYPLQMKVRQFVSESSELQTIASKRAVNYTERSLKAVVVVLAILPIMLVYPKLQKYFEKGAMLGSVKG